MLLEKTSILHNVIILIKLVFNKDKNNYYYNIFFKKCSYNNINRLYYDRIDVSEGIDVNKTSASEEYNICHYWYFLDKEFRFQPYIDNGCHDVLIMSISLNDIAILNINGADYSCIINGISKSDAANLL